MKCDLRWVTIRPFIIHQSWEPVAHQRGEGTASQKGGALATTRACSSSRKVPAARQDGGVTNLDLSGSSRVKSGQQQPCVSGCGVFFPQWSAATWWVTIGRCDGGVLGNRSASVSDSERPFHSRFTRAIFRSSLRSPVEFKRNENSSRNNNAACFRTKINLNHSASHCATPHCLNYVKTQILIRPPPHSQTLNCRVDLQ